MNKQLQDFARQTIKEGLALLPESAHRIFIKMYAGGTGYNLGVDIDMVVDEMPADRLDSAMQQVQRSTSKLEKEKEVVGNDIKKNV